MFIIDMISTWIKYEEKFYIIPSTGHIINKPFAAWTLQHQQVAQVLSSLSTKPMFIQSFIFYRL